MKAAIFYGGGVIKIEEVPKPKAGPKEAIVKVKYCGVCGSDRHIYYHGWPFPLVPETKPKTEDLKRLEYIPGHEISGIIDEVGEEIKDFKKGDEVAIYCVNYCGKCYYCKKGLTHYCLEFDKNIIGYHSDGGFAEYVKVPEKQLLKLPKDISTKLGNLTLDTIGVPYGAFLETDIKKDTSIAIYGCGPIGLSAIKILNQRGNFNIFAVDIVDSKLKIAKEFGAKVVINANRDNPVKLITDMTDGLGVEMAFDTSNTVEVLRNVVYSVRKGGNVYAIGEHPSLPPDLGEIFISDILVHRHLGIRGLMYFPIGGHKEIIDLLKKDKESFEKIITHVFPLNQINEAFNVFFKDNESIRVLVEL